MKTILTNIERRHKRIRAKISGTADVPRISVFKSNRYIYAQLIDDVKGSTIAATSGTDGKKVGTDLAKKALAANILKAVFDRGGYLYAGKIQAIADGAREGGLRF